MLGVVVGEDSLLWRVSSQFGTIVSDATIACKPFLNKTLFMILESIFKDIVYNLKKC